MPINITADAAALNSHAADSWPTRWLMPIRRRDTFSFNSRMRISHYATRQPELISRGPS